MHLQKAPSPWSCLPTAFAIAAGWPVETLISRLGHDGGDIRWPQLPEPKCRRGFHHQECIERLWRAGFAVTPFDLRPRLAPDATVAPLCLPYSRDAFDRIVSTTRGVLTGYTRRCGHAVAYDHGHVCDPRGSTYRYHQSEANDFFPLCAFVLTPRPQ